MTWWKPLALTYRGIEQHFRKEYIKGEPVAVSQSGQEVFPSYYCRLNEKGNRWECYPTVADAFNTPPTNVTYFDAAPPGALFL